MDDHEEKYQHGLNLCIEAGIIGECEYHPGTYFAGEEDPVSAFDQAESDADREAMKLAYDDNSGVDDCQSCDRLAHS